MFKKAIALVVLSSFIGSAALMAEPALRSKKKRNKNTKKETVAAITPAAPLPEGWSLVNGVWTHSDGYKYEKGQLFRIGTHTHKRPPKPPTKAQMDAVMKRKKPAPTAAEVATAKAAERERNLRPRPAPQTGSNL